MGARSVARTARNVFGRPSRAAPLWLGAFLLLLAAAPARADGPWLAASAGRFNISKTGKRVEIGLELRYPTDWYGLEIAVGAAGTEDGNVWVYGGLRRDFELESRWRLTPGFAIALYEEGDGKDLGGVVEFRSSIELAYLLNRRSRVGLTFYHLSNAGIYDKNPGSNSLVASYAFSLSGR